MLLAKMLRRSLQNGTVSTTLTASSGRGWLRSFKRNMATKKEQSIEFSPTKGAKIAEPVKPSGNPQILEEHLPRNIRFYRWWKTSTGRKVVLGMFIAGSAGVLLESWGKNSFLMKYIKDLYQQCHYGIPVKVDPYTKKTLLPAVIQDLELSKEEVENLSVFMMNGHGEPNSWGALTESSKAMLGLPFWFKFKDPEEVPLKQMQFGRQGTMVTKELSDQEESSEHAKNLANGMALSDQAKKFGIAREIIKVKELKPYILQGALSSVSVMACHTVARMINNKKRLFYLAPIFRGANYIMTMNLTFMCYWLVKDGLNRRTQGLMDQQAASISRQYAEGGIEYYTKQMMRNAAQRELVLGADKIYNLNGEEGYELIRKRNKPLAERRGICEEALKSFS